MVHIFAGEELYISNIRYLVQVLSSATLTLFQKGNKKQLSSQYSVFILLTSLWTFSGPRDHPDIAESFMYLHAQVSSSHL